ncbi:MAG: hypothetical protein J6Q96_01155 [Bacteroidales bacterium]|nr:hypothetical protein [Bacteroidales bacterium]
MKKLLIISRDRHYILDQWDIKEGIQKGKPISIISGMDVMGMYFQIKTEKKIRFEEIKYFKLAILEE